jgi:hypothetical protein
MKAVANLKRSAKARRHIAGARFNKADNKLHHCWAPDKRLLSH